MSTSSTPADNARLQNADPPADPTPPAVLPGPATTRQIAVAQFGAASVSLMIAERDGDGNLHELECLERPVALARDIFRFGRISQETMEQAAEALKAFRRMLLEYAIPIRDLRCHTTNILAEARNQEIFLNRMQVTSGAQVAMIDDGDMTRLLYLGIRRLLSQNPRLTEGNALVYHIGPGNTRVLYFRRGRIAGYSSYRLGIYRAREVLAAEDPHDTHANTPELLEENIRGVIAQLHEDYAGYEIDYHVATGNEIQIVAPHIARLEDGAYKVALADLAGVADDLAKKGTDAIVRRFRLNYASAEGVVPAIQTNQAVAASFDVPELWVPEGDFQRAFLSSLFTAATKSDAFLDEVLQSARNLGRKYKVDRKHARHVSDLAQALFRELRDLHNLASRFELLLRVAALVHEVGMFVSAREHHKHSLYIIANSEVFGLSEADRNLVALIARYHRRYAPERSHPHYSDLSQHERLVVLKLCALLRIADALDRSHTQRINSISVHRRDRLVVVECSGVTDTTVEQIAINGKGQLFRELFGCNLLFAPAGT